MSEIDDLKEVVNEFAKLDKKINDELDEAVETTNRVRETQRVELNRQLEQVP
jgi:hypothetical protein